MFLYYDDVLRSPGHVFYDRLQDILHKARFDPYIEGRCRTYHAEKGRPSIPLGRYFRMMMVGYFEGFSSYREIAWWGRSSNSDAKSCRDSGIFPPVSTGESRGWTVPKPCLTSLPVIKNIYIFWYDSYCLPFSTKNPPMDDLVYEQRPEALHWRIIMAFPLAAHWAYHTVSIKFLLVTMTTVLTAAFCV